MVTIYFLRRGDTYTPVPLPLGKNKRLSHEPRFNWNFIVSLFLELTSSLIKRFSRGSNRYPEFCQVASTDRCYPFIHLGEERPCESKLSYPNNTTQWEQTGRLPHMTKCVVQYAAYSGTNVEKKDIWENYAQLNTFSLISDKHFPSG